MKRTRKLLAAALAAVLALTILSGCSQTEYIYNTIVTPAAEPDPMTRYYVQVINEENDKLRDDTKKRIVAFASAELDQKAKEAAELINKGVDQKEAVREVMKNSLKEGEVALCGEEDLTFSTPTFKIREMFTDCISVGPLEEGQKVGALNWNRYTAFTVGTAVYRDKSNKPYRLMLVVAHSRYYNN